ncbi:MAG: division/cell wall cluster transcriptional repressor MraZ [Treponema sp.]|jgi:MraZ protein|nr:division/cell wall cluster transcriptional repressor MraZ [Treponema sp.]
MTMLTGEFKVTLDEKGRISLPASLRKDLNEISLRLTKGEDNCLWLFPLAKWEELVSTKIVENTNPFSRKDRSLLRRLIGPSQSVEIDKAGRIPVVQGLREFAGLSKDCMVLGQIDYIEIWDEVRYFKYLENSDVEFEGASEELSSIIKRKRGLSD